MRLLLVNSTHRWGGVKTWTLRAGRSLAARGHHVVVAGRRGDLFCRACREAGLPAAEYGFGASWSPLAIAYFRRLIRREGIQLAVCNVGRDLSTAGAAARSLGLPVIHRVGSIFDFRDTFVRRLVHRRIVSGMLVPARWMVDELARRFSWIGPAEIRASHHGAELLARQRRTGRPPVILTLGRLDPDKGQRELLKACAKLLGRGLDFRLVISGTGSDESHLRTLAKDCGLAERTEFTGFRLDVRPLLRSADLGVLYSTHEAISNVVVEFLCAGLAVVASDLPSLREVDAGSGCITFAPSGDPEALAEALGGLLEDPPLRERQSRLAVREASRRFTIEAEAERLECIFLDQLRLPDRRRPVEVPGDSG